MMGFSGLRKSGLLAGLLMLAILPAWAVIEIAPLSNEELEQRYRELIDELRCPKCQNQNLAASNSPIAADLREQIRVLLEEGKSDDEIVAYMVDRYGDFVRYRPAVKSDTLILWFAPGALLVVGLLVLVAVVRSNRRAARSGELSTAEERRLADLLGSDGSGGDGKSGEHRE